jgi:hypothetical protein
MAAPLAAPKPVCLATSFAFCASAAGQEEKRRCAEVGDQTGEQQRGRGADEIGRAEMGVS